MVTAVQASGGDVMVSGPFNWCTVGLLMATDAFKQSTPLHSCQIQPFIAIMYPQGVDGYFEQDCIPRHGDRIVQECVVQQGKAGQQMLMT